MNLEKILQEKGKIELENGEIIIKLSQDEFSFYNSIQKKNTGNYNSGYWNSGNRNSGNYNSGNGSSGDDNTGDYNYGEYNSGDYNYGDYNVGRHNINSYNTGNYNVGNCNVGHYNYGSFNVGSYNVGSCNTGEFNLSNYNTGCFNTKTPKMNFFDQETDMTMEEWRETEAFAILRKIDLSPVEWVWEEDMSEEEKEEYPEYKTTGGYLKELDTDKAFLSWWNALNEREKEIIKSIPNFDSEKFFKITGIRV